MSSETAKNVSEIITSGGGGWFVAEHSDVYLGVTLDREQQYRLAVEVDFFF